jgi:hypothetical protein
VIRECGYDEAVLGFSLSYNTSIERTKEILPKYAFGKSGENKFLESIQLWLDIDATRYYWQEFDTYRIGVTKNSESTMHTICKKPVDQSNFERPVCPATILYLNDLIFKYKTIEDKTLKRDLFVEIKDNLPEGYLQRRIVNLNYKSFRHIYEQRMDHKLPQWQLFFKSVLSKIEHPEFIIKDYYKENLDKF